METGLNLGAGKSSCAAIPAHRTKPSRTRASGPVRSCDSVVCMSPFHLAGVSPSEVKMTACIRAGWLPECLEPPGRWQGNLPEHRPSAACQNAKRDLEPRIFNTMNSRVRIVLAGAACIAGCAIVWGQAPALSTASGPGSSAEATDSQTMGPPPSPGHVWMAGHWNSEGGQWRWVAGHWDLPPTRSSIWVPGHWIQGGSGWAWVNGAWNVAEVPQSPATPPQPPSAPGQNATQASAQGGQAVPMPSTPAPNVAGQYAPGGQVPVAYQQPTETDYAPIYYDYAVTYPGYYWNGGAWGWGVYPGFAVGLGWWGPGYWGWGRGGWGHGGWGRGGWGHGGWGRGGWGHNGWGHGGSGGHGGGRHVH
jgi:hypothetical protein